MSAREQLIQEIEQVSDALVEEVLDFLLFVKGRQNQSNLSSADEETQRSQPSALSRMGEILQHLVI